MIVLDAVSFCYTRGTDVLNDVSLEFLPGMSLVVGPNGCGKSTLLKLAAGVEIPAQGRVTVAGFDLWREEVDSRRHIAYLPEHPDLTPYATVAEILALVCGLRARPAEEADEALRWVGLQGLGHRTVRELSKGQRRRATLAAARIGTPSCLLLDEPLDGMDREFRVESVRWVAERLAKGATVVAVSHDLVPLADLVDRVVIVRNGRWQLVEDLPSPGPARTSRLEQLAAG